jgi:hypothetical protein
MILLVFSALSGLHFHALGDLQSNCSNNLADSLNTMDSGALLQRNAQVGKNGKGLDPNDQIIGNVPDCAPCGKTTQPTKKEIKLHLLIHNKMRACTNPPANLLQ